MIKINGFFSRSLKKRLFTMAVILLTIGNLAFAEENEREFGPAAFGMGAEMNMNTQDNFAMGLSFYFDINLGRLGEGNSFAVGLTGGTSRSLNDFALLPVISVHEVGGIFRWYILTNDHTGLFVQAEGGAYFAQKFNESNVESATMPMGGLRGGYRFAFNLFYFEPYGRVGYPFIFSAGFLIGVRHEK